MYLIHKVESFNLSFNYMAITMFNRFSQFLKEYNKC